MQQSDERMEQLLHQLRQQPGLAEQIPGQQGEIVREALQGNDVYAIAQGQRISEAAVWQALSSAARQASGQPAAQAAESGGLGSDTDPGVSGGYGDTGFGSLGNEPPIPVPGEPQDEASG